MVVVWFGFFLVGCFYFFPPLPPDQLSSEPSGYLSRGNGFWMWYFMADGIKDYQKEALLT